MLNCDEFLWNIAVLAKLIPETEAEAVFYSLSFCNCGEFIIMPCLIDIALVISDIIGSGNGLFVACSVPNHFWTFDDLLSIQAYETKIQ